jgi:putative acetyltransferase
MPHAVTAPGRLDVDIRPARRQDVATLLALRAAALRDIREPYSSGQIVRWLDAVVDGDLRAAIDEADDAVCCAAVDGGLVGFVRVGYDTSVHLLGLFVDPAWQRRGIGTVLIDAAHARCRARRVARVIVAASLNAVPFYARHGYDSIERFEWRPSGAGDEAPIPLLKMVKHLR